jgi:dipeptidyl aminopeptidase/acylaminoacyl peptidase
MTVRAIWAGVLAAMLAGACGAGWAQDAGVNRGGGSGASAGKRPMTFADLQRMKRVGDPQISPSGRWVMFSVVDVDLEKNSKVSHLWVVPMGASGALQEPAASSGASSTGKERQVTFWKEGESGGRFSPDGRQVLFVATDSTDGLSQIFLAPWDEAAGTVGTPTRLTNVSTEVDGPIWSPDSQRILFASRVYPECSNETAWVDEDNCDRKRDEAAAASPVKAQIFDHLLYRHWDHYVGPKRSHVLVVSTTDGNAVRDLTPRGEIGDAEAPVFSLGGPMGYAWAPDSKEIAFVTNLDLVPAASTNNDVFTLRLDEASAMPVKVSTSPGGDDGPAFSPDGKWLAFRSQARAGYESDRFRLMVFDRVTKTLTELVPKLRRPQNAPYDGWIDEFVWAADSSSFLLTSAIRGEEAIFSYDLCFGCVPHQLGTNFRRITNDGEFGDLELFMDPKTLMTTALATRMTADQPSEVFSLDVGLLGHGIGEILYGKGEPGPDINQDFSRVEHQLTHMNDAVLSQLDHPKMESFWFTGADDAKVQGFVIRPPNFDPSRRYPLKFLIHGGPQGAWGDMWSYRWNPELMAASGYVVVMVNPRGSTGYGQAFIDGINGDWGGKAYVDLMKGLDAAEAKYPFIDKTRECALGASYGGFMADWILTHTNRFACIVTHDGMFNPQSAYGTTEELWFNEWEFRTPGSAEPGQPWNYFDKPVAEDPFRKWSPMLSIRNARTPTLVIHSQRDYRLDVSEGFQLFTALQRLDVPSRMLYFPDEGHWVMKPQNSKLWYETVGDWCDRWTKTNAYALGPVYGAPPAVVAPRTEAKAPRAPKGKKKPLPTPKTEAVVPSIASEGAAAPSAPVAETTAPSSPQVGLGHASFAITISGPQGEVRVGSDVAVGITLRNVSDHQIMFGHRPGTNNPEFSYEIEMRNAQGQLVEETAYGREAHDPRRRQEESRTVDYVQPGGTTVQTAHIAKLVSLSRPGSYTVLVSRKDTGSGEVVRSNEVKFAIVP